ncbi:MAG TPA: GDP-mannose 4,6-dehydratase, partial [Longimicrobiales bacterium]|nr:GDP-mannose 4,6-dehydratase [Longimicrobiales bacterium]
MKVLVTGADGFVGQHVVRVLLDRGHQVVGGIHGDEPALSTLPREQASLVEWRPFDLSHGETVHDLVRTARPDALLHLAGVTSVSRSWRDPETTFQVNATGALHLLMAVRRLPAPAVPRPVLLVGSGEVYGVDGTEEAPLREDRPTSPVNPYGASKAAQEAVATALGRGDAVRLIQTRSFQQIGPGQRATFVTVDWARQLLAIRDAGADPVLRVGNLDITRDFLDVTDAARAYVDLLEDSGTAGTFNVCSGRGTTLRRLLALLQEAVGVPADVQ